MEKGKLLDYDVYEYRDGEPCYHKGCLNHRTHPCEICNRINAKGKVKIRK